MTPYAVSWVTVGVAILVGWVILGLLGCGVRALKVARTWKVVIWSYLTVSGLIATLFVAPLPTRSWLTAPISVSDFGGVEVQFIATAILWPFLGPTLPSCGDRNGC